MRINKTVTLNGSPQQISYLFGYNGSGQKGAPMIIDRIFCQMKTGGTHTGYVMDGIPFGTTPDPTTDGQLTAELMSADANNPGGTYSDQAYTKDGGGIIGEQFWIQGTNTEKMVVSVDVRV